MRMSCLASVAPRAAVSLWLVGLGATAQAAPGDHIGTESAQLIPSLEVGAQHRTNAYLQEGESAGGVPTTPGTALVLNPRLAIRAKNSDLLFNFNFSYTAKKYLQSEVTNLDRYNIFDLSAGLQLFPESTVGFRVNDAFSITGYEAEDEAKVSESSYQQHLLNKLGAYVTVRPGGPLEADVGGVLNLDQWNVPEEFKSQDTTDDLTLTSSLTGPGLNSRLGYGPDLEVKWRFFPKTAVVSDFNYEWFSWQDNIVDAKGDGISRQEVGDYLAVPDGRLWRARGGLRGRITDKLVVSAMVGFGQALYREESVTEQAAELGIDGSDEFADSVGFGADLKTFPAGLLGEAEVEYTMVENHKLLVSYRRDFQDTYFSNYVDYDRAFAQYTGRYADVIGVDLNGMYRFERYLGEVSRNDHLLRAGLGATWYAQDYLSVKLGGSWGRRASADGNHPEIEYDDFRFEGGVVFTY